MEIQVNGEVVQLVEGFVRNIAIRLDSGEVTNFDVSPKSLVVNVVVTPKIDANAPRLDELEALERLVAPVGEAEEISAEEEVTVTTNEEVSETPAEEGEESTASFDFGAVD